MPFTVSHAAAIIPFNRKPFVLSALVIGSMSPDFLYFIPFIPNYHLTHTFQGLFLFCLPTSLIALVIYHKFLKYPIISLLPWQIQRRLFRMANSFKFLSIPKFLGIICSILLGALTHVIWDSFTHNNGQAVLLFPFLTRPVFSFAGETIFLYKLLQYLSTIVGGLIVVAWFFDRVWHEKPINSSQMVSKNTSPYWLPAMTIMSCTFGLIYGWSWFDIRGFKGFVVHTVIGSMISFFVLLIVFSFAWYIYGNVRHH